MTAVTFSCCLWDAREDTPEFSRCYDEAWVDKLFRAVARNVSRPFHFVLFTDRARRVSPGIAQRRLSQARPDYGALIEPFSLDRPTIIMGLDTVIVRNIDHLVDYCLRPGAPIAAPRDPYKPEQLINPFILVPKGHLHVRTGWHGQNDMDWLRRYPWQPMDDLWPGQLVSLKFHRLRTEGLPTDARVVYFHGRPKPDELTHLDWIREHWR